MHRIEKYMLFRKEKKIMSSYLYLQFKLKIIRSSTSWLDSNFIFVSLLHWESWSLAAQLRCSLLYGGFPGCSVLKNPPDNAGDTGPVSGSGRSPGGENGNPLQYFCLENPMDSLRSLASYSPWGREALDTAESAHTGIGLLCMIIVLLIVNT